MSEGLPIVPDASDAAELMEPLASPVRASPTTGTSSTLPSRPFTEVQPREQRTRITPGAKTRHCQPCGDSTVPCRWADR